VTIRLRLTAWYVLVLVIGLAVFGSAVFFHSSSVARSNFDAALRQRTTALLSFIRLSPGVRLAKDAPDEGAGQLGGASIWIRVVDGQGRQVASQGPPLAGVPNRLLHTSYPGFHDSGPLRVFVLPINSRGHRIGSIQALTTTALLSASEQQLLNSLLLAGTFIVIVAAVGGFFIAQLALRPVHKITRIAREIGSSDLSRRVTPEVAGTRRRHGRDEIISLARTFDDMLQRLEEADLRRRRFAADAAHELATPLASIKAGAEVALRQPRKPAEYKETLRQVAGEGDHLERVVDDLILLASADDRNLSMHRELIEVNELLRHIGQAMTPLAKNADLDLSLALPSRTILAWGDEIRLGQVVRNLIDNALRHTPPGGSITVSASSESDATATISVRDTGAGIPNAERSLVFERFHRIRARSDPSALASGERRHGSGLGLAICKAIVEAHGGRIAIADTEGPGTTVTVTIPVIDTNSDLDALDVDRIGDHQTLTRT
jgi:signal transduction histidine kinase